MVGREKRILKIKVTGYILKSPIIEGSRLKRKSMHLIRIGANTNVKAQ
jgi:hypothetical protein